MVNFCIKAPNTKPFFYTSINTSGIIQSAAAVAGDIIEVIETLGPQKFRSIITDNAPVMKAAWKLIEEKFPHISTYGCAAHDMNLLVKDILSTAESSIERESQLIFLAHSQCLFRLDGSVNLIQSTTFKWQSMF